MYLSKAHTSPNYDRRAGAINTLVFHYTGMGDGALALRRLCQRQSKVSAHYLIEEDGTVYALVDEKYRAWHAGRSFWRGLHDLNSHSIGIELVNPGHDLGYRPFPKKQIGSLISLSKSILARYAITPFHVVGHGDIAPWRKSDPGELFNWSLLAENGIGLWPRPKAGRPTSSILSPQDAGRLLTRIGYVPIKAMGAPQNTKSQNTRAGDTKPQNTKSQNTRAGEPGDGPQLRDCLVAFQRRFCPDHISGTIDAQTCARLIQIGARYAPW